MEIKNVKIKTSVYPEVLALADVELEGGLILYGIQLAITPGGLKLNFPSVTLSDSTIQLVFDVTDDQFYRKLMAEIYAKMKMDMFMNELVSKYECVKSI